MPVQVPKLHFRRHEYYDDLMGGARRKPALPIAGPAVTRHVAFFYPNYPELKREIWVDAIEKYILALYHHLEDNDYLPHTRSLRKDDSGLYLLYLLDNSYALNDKKGEHPSAIRQRPTRYQTFRVRFYYGLMPVSISIELHDEYFTVSTIIDLAWPPHPGPACKAQRDCAVTENLRKVVEDFARIADERLAHPARSQGDKGVKQAHQRAFKDAYLFIYETIWDEVQAAIFEDPLKETKDACKCELGGVFADFRGFVATIAEKGFINGPYTHVSDYSLQRRIGEQTFKAGVAASEIDVVDYADVLLPWLKADQGFAQQVEDREPDRTEPVEFTVSLLLRQRTLFASALGAQLSRQRGEQGPVTFIALSKNASRWQAGRLIDRVHMLGTLRIAALYNLPDLIQADNELRELENEIKAFVSPLPEQAGDLEEERPEQAGKLEDKLRGWLQRFDDIERQPEKGKAQIIGGLAYRVERSGYYQSQFKEHWDGFRVDRIEGFAPLDEAVNRRLAGDYELIRTVAEHHRRLQQTLASLGRQLQQDAIAKETRTIERLQLGAERGFFAVLFPYYVSRVLVDLAQAAKLTDRFPELHLELALTVLAIAIGVITAFYRPLRNRLKLGSITAGLLAIVFIVAVTVFFTWASTLYSPTVTSHAEQPVARSDKNQQQK